MAWRSRASSYASMPCCSSPCSRTSRARRRRTRTFVPSKSPRSLRPNCRQGIDLGCQDDAQVDALTNIVVSEVELDDTDTIMVKPVSATRVSAPDFEEAAPPNLGTDFEEAQCKWARCQRRHSNPEGPPGQEFPEVPVRMIRDVVARDKLAIWCQT